MHRSDSVHGYQASPVKAGGELLLQDKVYNLAYQALAAPCLLPSLGQARV
jgi:hypothetical protein